MCIWNWQIPKCVHIWPQLLLHVKLSVQSDFHCVLNYLSNSTSMCAATATRLSVAYHDDLSQSDFQFARLGLTSNNDDYLHQTWCKGNSVYMWVPVLAVQPSLRASGFLAHSSFFISYLFLSGSGFLAPDLFLSLRSVLIYVNRIRSVVISNISLYVRSISLSDQISR
jgi:hypothetical protein